MYDSEAVLKKIISEDISSNYDVDYDDINVSNVEVHKCLGVLKKFGTVIVDSGVVRYLY